METRLGGAMRAAAVGAERESYDTLDIGLRVANSLLYRWEQAKARAEVSLKRTVSDSFPR